MRPREIARATWRELGSTRLATILISSLLLLSFLSVLVPQADTLGTKVIDEWRRSEPRLATPVLALGLDRVFTSWPYWLLSAMLALNLTLCTTRRARTARAVPRKVGTPPEVTEIVPVHGDAAAVADLLRVRMRGFEVYEVDDGVVCRSGRWGLWGSVLMHSGLVLLIAAVSLTGMTRFEGEMLLTEGVSAQDEMPIYTKVTRLPVWGDPYSGAELTLERMEFDYAGPEVTEAKAYMRVDEGGGDRRFVARVNHPLRVGTKSFLLEDSGYAVGIRALDPSGTAVPDALVNLGRPTPDGSADSVDLDGLHLDLNAVADAMAPRGASIAQKMNPTDPAVIVTATVAGRAVLRGALLRPGGTAQAGGWTVKVLEVRRWTSFYARRDLGVYVAYLALALVVLGPVARVLDPDRTVRLRLGDGKAAVWARSRWGPGPAESAERRVIGLLTDDGPGAGDEDVRE